MGAHGSDVARTITSAGELATGAVNKSLKDLEQSSRAAIDQSRQVSIAAVTEMQETSKILRTDTVALFERLREGNILLQEVLTGAHDNLNSLERALVTRVADFVSAMNDVTSRNGAATQTLEDQLTVFNDKTARALEDLNALSSQFDAHGKALVEAAAVVEQANRTTTDLRRRAQVDAGIAGHHHRSAHRRSRPAAVALHRACSMNRLRLPRSAPATSPASWRRPPAPARPRSAASSRRCARRPRKSAGRRSTP